MNQDWQLLFQTIVGRELWVLQEVNDTHKSSPLHFLWDETSFMLLRNLLDREIEEKCPFLIARAFGRLVQIKWLACLCCRVHFGKGAEKVENLSNKKIGYRL